jgi:cobalt-zinc-cadmium resistance protein CzcA
VQQDVRDVAAVRGASQTQVEVTSGVVELSIRPDRSALARYGLDFFDVQETVAAAAPGEVISEVIDGQRRYNVALRLPDRYRSDPMRCAAFCCERQVAEQVALDQVASIEVTRGPENIEREENQRRVVAICNVRGCDLGSFVAEVRARLTAIWSRSD